MNGFDRAVDWAAGAAAAAVGAVLRPLGGASAAPGAVCAGGRRLCAGVVASNADAFHSSGVRNGPRLLRVELARSAWTTT